MKQYCALLIILFCSISNIMVCVEKKSHHKKSSHKNLLSKGESDMSVFSELKKPKTKAKSVQENPDMILQPNEKIDITLSDWMMISSPQFKNTKKFPPLELPSGEEVRIKIDSLYYRINDFFTKNGNPNNPPSDKHFWFRLSGRHLYYSINKEDINVLGSIAIKSIGDVEEKKPYAEDKLCFKVIDENVNEWKICPQTFQKKAEWICTIREKLKIFDENCRKTILADSEITILTKKVTQPIILVAQPNRVCNDQWDYSRNGSDWECDCQEGKEQSPIDLPNKENAIGSPAKPLFQYDEVPSTRTVTTEEGLTKSENIKIQYSDSTLKIKNTEFGKVVTLDGSVYLATDIHFHTPSEHTINGKHYDMEMQIIHSGQTKGDIGKQVILSFLFEKKPGAYNKFIDDIDFFNLPNPSNLQRDIINNLYIPKIFYSSDDDDLPIMKPFSFYTYQGSLTQPPCTERTIMYVASKPIPLGTTALTLFKEAARIPDMMDANGNVIVNTNAGSNNRKTQPLNGRKVFHYDHTFFCGPDPPAKAAIPKDGHYEKIIKKQTEYFYVNSESPSRLPGAFVVSEGEAKGYIN